MANPEHIEVLKQGADVWNQWKKENLHEHPDSKDADLTGIDLTSMNLAGALFHRANLSGVALTVANLRMCLFFDANLVGADLRVTHLDGAMLMNADLRGAYFGLAVLRGTHLTDANLTGAGFGGTVLADCDFSGAKGLESCYHIGPSSVDHLTVVKSRVLPNAFLQGCGLPQPLIDYYPSLLNNPLEFQSCFISYSTLDRKFGDQLYSDLKSKGVPCWYAPVDLEVGAKFRPAIDETIHMNDRLLLVLSRHSIDSQWVEKEVETALEKERQRKETVLFPIRLDNAAMVTTTGWAADIRRTRHIGDFSSWMDKDAYRRALERLLRDLRHQSRTRAASTS